MISGHETEQHTDTVRNTVKQLDVPVLKISRPYPQWEFLTSPQNPWPPAMVISPSLLQFLLYFSSLSTPNLAHTNLFHVHLALSSSLPRGSSQLHHRGSVIKHTHESVSRTKSSLSLDRDSTLCLKVVIFLPLHHTPHFSSSNNP